MASISSKIWAKKSKGQQLASGGAGSKAAASGKALLMTAAMMALAMAPEVALADSATTGGTGFLCYIATYFKAIVGSSAIVVIMLWAVEHIFGVSRLHDVVIKVGVGAAIAVGASSIVVGSGLTSSCVV